MSHAKGGVLKGPRRGHRALAEAASGTWHHGLIARWWVEFNVAQPDELAYYGTAIRRFGEPALDLGCGNGRILIPLLAAGLDVDGTDISADMIRLAGAQAAKGGFTPRLTVQPMHELDLVRTYRTIFICGAFGIGGRRDHDRESLRRAYRHLEPGGALLITNHVFPYGETDETRWARWLPRHRAGIPREWPTKGERRKFSDGDEIEWLDRLVEFDPLAQRLTYEVRVRLWRDGKVIKEEAYGLREGLYFAQEILLMLDQAGFRDVVIEAYPAGRPATADDGTVAYVARK